MSKKIIKWMVFAFSFFMFCYQAQIAIYKLYNPTVVDITERKKITDIVQPLITVCPQQQLDDSEMSEYDLKYQLMNGSYNDTEGSLGWGAQVDMTFEQLKKQLYAVDLETISIGQETQQGFQKAHYEIRFYPIYGWCFDISNYTITGEVHLELMISDDLSYEVFLTDKNLRTMSIVHTQSHWGSDIIIYPGQTQKVKVKVEQLSSYDPLSPDSCKEYADGEFERCVDEELQKVWKPLINCNPPWLSSQDQCTGLLKVSNATYSELMKEPHDTIFEILYMKTYAAKERCTKPCTLTRSNILSNGHRENNDYDPRKFLKIKFDDLVIKHRKVIGYYFSDFLIDMGSSLGLWFGLSVFGILDLGILIMQWMKKLKKAMKYFN